MSYMEASLRRQQIRFNKISVWLLDKLSCPPGGYGAMAEADLTSGMNNPLSEADPIVPTSDAAPLSHRVRDAVFWRSGSQIVAQMITWGATFLVIRILNPADYGLFAMTQVVLVFLHLLNGYGIASALIQSEKVSTTQVRQVFGMLILLNAGLGLAQIALAPLAAAYFRQPMLDDLLRVQALLYVATPFIAVPNALLSRGIDYQNQAKINLVAAILSAATAYLCASAGWGVWALVVAPIVLFWTRAVAMMVAAKCFVWPSFQFAGAGGMFRFGGALMVTQLFWFVQSQADVFVAGRSFEAHDLGIYTTAVFLATILVGKFVPPLNDVAFAAYSRIQGDTRAIAHGFVKALQVIMLVVLPFYAGLAATAEPLVLTMLGPKWSEIIPFVRLLAFAMPFMTLQILFAPATNAIGKPSVATRNAAIGAVVMPTAFLVGVHWGIPGLVAAWLIGFPLLTALTAAVSMPVIGIGVGHIGRAVAPGLAASTGMALAVWALDALIHAMAPAPRLAILVAGGSTIYAALLMVFARPLVREIARLLLKRTAT